MASTGIRATAQSAKSTAFLAPSSRAFLRARWPFSPDAVHSQRENRFRGIGRTQQGRGVFITFTLRQKVEELLIRPISARYMHQKEIDAFEKENPGL
jgi:uncharacterized DUF497 family protein